MREEVELISGVGHIPSEKLKGLIGEIAEDPCEIGARIMQFDIGVAGLIIALSSRVQSYEQRYRGGGASCLRTPSIRLHAPWGSLIIFHKTTEFANWCLINN